MKKTTCDLEERLMRVRTVRRGKAVEIRVHYQIERHEGCDTYRLFAMEEVD